MAVFLLKKQIGWIHLNFSGKTDFFFLIVDSTPPENLEPSLPSYFEYEGKGYYPSKIHTDLSHSSILNWDRTK